MQIAFVHATARGAVDDTLRTVTDMLRARGHRLAGVLPVPCTDPDRHACDMDLIDLASGACLPIAQRLGRGSTGCRLDGAAIEMAAMAVAGGLATAPADLLILNRFGKQEATGHGFHPVIVTALERGMPVLLGVNDLNRPAFEIFADGLATELPDAPFAVCDWLLPLLRRRAA
ncbi:Protein of unknown function [Roseovarius azorensis]|uniref:Nucleoside-triphosphatase THEP1 n=1 Tax=Roseovarius azorensis TaxID=1287727 RepID=A0A1H7N7T4_9RHOB|nr:DUF2478 domain-containing protein [Roseovarius azorensis]SEL19554.1 Protein of unknown function [Roseovarius azorensis]